ncbi:hypothetical protein COCSADRAFT_299418, partial [Bipolaris sorokiniana ND90Pr]
IDIDNGYLFCPVLKDILHPKRLVFFSPLCLCLSPLQRSNWRPPVSYGHHPKQTTLGLGGMPRRTDPCGCSPELQLLRFAHCGLVHPLFAACFYLFFLFSSRLPPRLPNFFPNDVRPWLQIVYPYVRIACPSG